MNMKIMDKITAWILLLFGFTHCVIGLVGGGHLDVEWTFGRIWFLGGGLAMVYLGVLNLLRVAYWERIASLASLVLLCNLTYMTFSLWLGLNVNLRANPQIVMGMIVVAVMIHFSLQQTLARKPVAK